MYFGIRGALSVIDGKDSGWADMSTSIDFCGWSVKLQVYLQGRGGSVSDLSNHTSRIACLACISTKWAGFAEGILRSIDDGQWSIDKAFWKSRKLEPFVRTLGKIRDGKMVRASEDNCGPYDQVINSWGNEAALANALWVACEYHCENIYDVGGNWDPEFKHPPFDLIPCEVVYVNRIRQEIGLPVPAVQHDLVSLLEFEPRKIAHSQEHQLIQELQYLFGAAETA